MGSRETFFDTAQALLTGFDTALSKQWREEDRQWRKEDLEYRQQEIYYNQLDASFMEEERRWRADDLEQRVLDNARVLWTRIVEHNQRDVEERAEQLKGMSNLAALMAGFALTSFLQFDFDVGANKQGIVLGFGVTTAIVVALNVISMMMCGLIHSSILKTGPEYVSEEEEADFIMRCREYAIRYQPGDKPPAPRRNFRNHWDARCENEWRRAFYFFSAGVPVLMLNLVFAAFIKFKGSPVTAVVMTVILSTGAFYFLFAHAQWAQHLLYGRSTWRKMEPDVQFTPVGLPFDWHQRPARRPNAYDSKFRFSRTTTTASAGAESDAPAVVNGGLPAAAGGDLESVSGVQDTADAGLAGIYGEPSAEPTSLRQLPTHQQEPVQRLQILNADKLPP